MDWDYWGKPVPGYGDPSAKLLLIGLAPARHGGNRTGRVFTGDKSADFLVHCLHRAGMANQPNSDSLDDGLELFDIYMTPVVKCVPPGDKPTSNELADCFNWFDKELALLDYQAVLALGKIAFDTYLKYCSQKYNFKKKDFPFLHDSKYLLPNGKILIGCYHPSPRNVNTGRLTESMMLDLLNKVKDTIK